MAARSSALCTLRSVPLWKYCRSSSFPDFGGMLVRCAHDSILSRNGVPWIPGRFNPRAPGVAGSTCSTDPRCGRCRPPCSSAPTPSGAWVSLLDCQVELVYHYRSVPHAPVGQEVELRITRTTVEVLFGHQREASDDRSHRRGRNTTLAEHMPAASERGRLPTSNRLRRASESVRARRCGIDSLRIADEMLPMC